MKHFNKITLLGIFLLGIGWWTLSNLYYSKESENLTSLFTENEEGEENEEQRRINAEERWKAEFEMIKNPVTGKIPKGIRAKELKAAFKASQYQLPSISTDKSLPSITITAKGPNNYGGRTRALGFDTRNTSIVLSGGVTSGIYRSTNGGGSWTRVTPAGEVHSLTCLAQDPRVGHQDTWYAGTGEAGSSAGGQGSSDTYLGHGIFKSTDNGLTWTAIAATQSNLEVYNTAFDIVHRIVVNSDNGNLIIAASDVILHFNVSTNTATTVIGSLANTRQGDVIYNSVSDKFYAAIHGQDANGGVYESLNGTVWTQIGTLAELNPTGDAGFGYDVERIILTNVAATDDILAFFQLTSGFGFTCGNGGSTQAGLAFYDYTSAGVGSWTIHTDEIGNCTDEYTASTALPTQLELQGGYNMALATKPNDANIVYLAGTEGYRYNLSTNDYELIGGSQLAANSVNLHVDQHIFMFEPGSNDIMWAGNDGGLRKTDVTGTITAVTNNHDNGYSWTDRNTDYNGYQYYGVDIDPTNSSDFIIGGAQDNAFTIQPVGATALEIGPTADGVDVAVISGGSDFNTHNVFLMWQNGSMLRQENGSYATGTINPASTGFVGRFYLDADNTNYMYFPSNTGTLHRTRIAESIASSTTTGNSATGWESLTGISTAVGSNEISAMDASRNVQYGGNYTASDANRKLYFGTKNGDVFRLDDPAFATAGTTPVNIKPTGGSGFVSDIAVNPLDDKEILVTYSNYGVNSVYHTSDASVASPTWTNVEGATNTAVELASARSAMITVNNGTIVYMVGTSTGLYATDALSGATTTWTRLGTNTDIGVAVCVEMRLRTSDNKVVLGTHGNGAFLLEFPGTLPVELAAFRGDATEKGNLLAWETAAEINNNGFEVQKSFDGKTFEKIGFVEGNGTSVEAHNYTFLDKNINQNIAYYRLKQIDFNDGFEYSDIISIKNESITNNQIQLYPNPMVNNLTIENGEGNINIYTVSGKLVRQLKIQQSQQQIDVSNFLKGIYWIKISKENGESTTHKVVKR